MADEPGPLPAPPPANLFERQAQVVEGVQYRVGMDPLPAGVVLDEQGAAYLPNGELMRIPVHDTDWITTTYYGVQQVVDDATFQLQYAKKTGPVARLVP